MKDLEKAKSDLGVMKKSLASLKEKHKTELSKIRNRHQNEEQAIKNKIARLEDTLREAKPKVTDHAVIRFLERHYGFDFEAIRREIMTPQLQKGIEFGAKSIKAKGGTFKIKEGRVITFIPL